MIRISGKDVIRIFGTRREYFRSPPSIPAFAAWVFMALRFSLDLHVVGCGLTAILVGVLLAIGAHRVVGKATAA